MEENPDQLVRRDFRKWKSRGYSTSTTAYNASLAGTTTTTTATDIASNEEVILNEICTETVLNEKEIAPVIHREIVLNEKVIYNIMAIRNNSQEEGTEPKDVSSNLNYVANDDDEIDNTKFYSSTVPLPLPITTSSTTTTTSVIRTKIVLKEEEIALNKTCTGTERVSKKDPSSNLNIADDYEYSKDDVSSNLIVDVVDADVADDDDIDNVKSPPECNNLIGDSNGIKDK